MSNNVLIIGASSMLGRRLGGYLEQNGYHVFSCGRHDDCEIRYDLGDSSVPIIPDGFCADYVFHCAASFADDSLSGCIQNEKVNALSAYIVGEIASTVGCKHLIYAGSIFSSFPLEGASMSSYGASKLRGENILEWSLRRHNILFTSLRFSQIYDENGECCRHQLWFGRIVAYAYAGSRLRVPGGSAKRNFLHIGDAVRLMYAAMKKNESCRLEITHPESITYEEIAHLANGIFNHGGSYEIALEKQPFHEIYIPQSDKSYAKLNCWPEISMRDGLKMIKDKGCPQNFGPMDVS